MFYKPGILLFPACVCIFQALQVLLQPVIETLIYLDRKIWLHECDLGCDIIPVFDEYKSPRNLALIAVK